MQSLMSSIVTISNDQQPELTHLLIDNIVRAKHNQPQGPSQEEINQLFRFIKNGDTIEDTKLYSNVQLDVLFKASSSPEE